MVFGELMVRDKAGKAAPSLALVEKRHATRPGGFVGGILFQLFDWHRKFAKKKLSSRKLLPPAPPKEGTRNIRGDEKMPAAKLHHIADEKKPGCPNSRQVKNVDTERKTEMEKPGLVARLMGLESMPFGHREKVDEASVRDNYHGKGIQSMGINKGSRGREEVNMEKRPMRHEQPQKLQKAKISLSQAETRYEADPMQIKGVLSRSRKQNDAKLAPPSKGPQISSARNSSNKSRLIGSAGKILEPGVQAKTRAKYTLTYPQSMRVSNEHVTVESLAPEKKPCGRLLQNVIRQYVDDEELGHSPPSGTSSGSSGFFNAPYSGSESSKTLPILPVDKHNVFSRRRLEESIPRQDHKRLPVEHREPYKKNVFSTTRQDESMSLKDSKRLPVEYRESRRLPATTAPLREDSFLVAPVKSRRVSSAASSVSCSKDFVALNRSLNGQTRPSSPSKGESSSSDASRRSHVRRDDPVSHLRPPIRKMRTASSNQPLRSVSSRDSSSGKQMNAAPVAVTSNGRPSDKCGVISFTFNSRLKQEMASCTEAEDGKSSQSGSSCETNDSGDRILERSDQNASPQDKLAIKGDALGAILEQKLKELLAQEEDESTSGSTSPKRSTAIILQELIAALTTDPTLSQDSNKLGTNNAFQVKSRAEGSLADLSCETDRFSPGSVLEASFSNDSCLSSSLDDNSGLNLPTDYADFSTNIPQTTEPDGHIFVSATKPEKGGDCRNIVINLIGCINVVISELNLGGIGLSESKVSYAKEVILHSQMLFHDTTHPGTFSVEDIITSPSLLNELESHAILSWTETGWCDGLLGLKEERQLREFLFDCLLECIDSKYHPSSNFGYLKWRKLPPRLNKQILIRDIEGGLKTWAGLNGNSVDEMIGREMSRSLGKWVDFDIEAFENGCEIESGIYQDVLGEVVDDFLKSN